ncbi:hypothetical protein [Phaeobacter sp.]|uniref:hypothetical protein n=1 Tax=Phaeobacter sp. TaxID=1902409 RepID=UPI0025F99208|nr:hypothetical protein [Phaeobacter sp.]
MEGSFLRSRSEGLRSGCRLIVTLDVVFEGEVRVAAAEVLQHDMRNRVAYAQLQTLSETFHPQLATCLADCVEAFLRRGETHHPDMVADIPGLILANVSIAEGDVSGNITTLYVTFNSCIGDMARGFVSELRFGCVLEDVSRDMSAQVLNDLAMPLLNVLTAEEAGMIDSGDPVGGLADQLVRKAHEIRFQIELIKRYANSLERERLFSRHRGIPNAPSRAEENA